MVRYVRVTDKRLHKIIPVLFKFTRLMTLNMYQYLQIKTQIKRKQRPLVVLKTTASFWNNY